MKKISPLVSVIIPIHNRSHLIKRAFDSILNQTYKNLEIIIVDDGSNDNLRKVLKNDFFCQHDFQYIRLERNYGVSRARNKGLEAAKGQFITFLDSDDEYLSDKVELQLKLFQNSKIKNLGAVSCGRIDFRDGLKYNEQLPRHRGNVFNKLLSKKTMGAGTPFLMVKREIIDRGIRFDETIPAGEDYDFLLSISKFYNFDFVKKPLVKVNHHSGERAYSKRTAIDGFRIQYLKYGPYFKENPTAHKFFILKFADILNAYGNNFEAIKLLEKLPPSLDKFIWKKFFIHFRGYDNLTNKLMINLLRKIYF